MEETFHATSGGTITGIAAIAITTETSMAAFDTKSDFSFVKLSRLLCVAFEGSSGSSKSHRRKLLCCHSATDHASQPAESETENAFSSYPLYRLQSYFPSLGSLHFAN